jgi:hypothetical protein
MSVSGVMQFQKGVRQEWRFYEAADFVKTRWNIISFIFD